MEGLEARARPGARQADYEMARARYAMDWERQFELMIDPKTAREIWERSSEGCRDKGPEACSMCGPKFCAMRLSRELGEKERSS